MAAALIPAGALLIVIAPVGFAAAAVVLVVVARIYARRSPAPARQVFPDLDDEAPGRPAPMLVAVNSHARGVGDPARTAREVGAVLEELGADADTVVTVDEEALWAVLRRGAATGRRVVLVGGDGTVDAAARAPLKRLPELALLPAGRANKVARRLGIPTSRQGALAIATGMPAIPLTEPLPLVADAPPLGTTTATASVEPARLRVASPGRTAA